MGRHREEVDPKEGPMSDRSAVWVSEFRAGPKDPWEPHDVRITKKDAEVNQWDAVSPAEYRVRKFVPASSLPKWKLIKKASPASYPPEGVPVLGKDVEGRAGVAKYMPGCSCVTKWHGGNFRFTEVVAWMFIPE
jgi:hypothetical protein